MAVAWLVVQCSNKAERLFRLCFRALWAFAEVLYLVFGFHTKIAFLISHDETRRTESKTTQAKAAYTISKAAESLLVNTSSIKCKKP